MTEISEGILTGPQGVCKTFQRWPDEPAFKANICEVQEARDWLEWSQHSQGSFFMMVGAKSRSIQLKMSATEKSVQYAILALLRSISLEMHVQAWQAHRPAMLAKQPPARRNDVSQMC